MRMIDADALFPGKLLVVNLKNPMETAKDLLNRINNAPTIDAVPVVHGQWIKQGNEKKCSVCEFIYYSNNDDFNHCPNCGADMRGRENDGV